MNNTNQDDDEKTEYGKKLAGLILLLKKQETVRWASLKRFLKLKMLLIHKKSS